MSSYDPDFQDLAKPSPSGYEPTPERKGCWFYGCMFVVASAVLVSIGLAAAGFLLYRTVNRYVEEYTAVAPMALPKVELTEKQRKSALERVKAFRDALKAKARARPLVLTGDDLNALVEETPKLKGRVHLTIVDDAVKARVSLPVDEFFDSGFTRGRYFNAEAKIRAEVEDGRLKLAVDSVDVDGKPLPDAVRDFFARPNIILDFDKDKEHEDLLRAIESIDVKDGRIVITPRPAEQQGPSRPDSKPHRESSSAGPA